MLPSCLRAFPARVVGARPHKIRAGHGAQGPCPLPGLLGWWFMRYSGPYRGGNKGGRSPSSHRCETGAADRPRGTQVIYSKLSSDEITRHVDSIVSSKGTRASNLVQALAQFGKKNGNPSRWSGLQQAVQVMAPPHTAITSTTTTNNNN